MNVWGTMLHGFDKSLVCSKLQKQECNSHNIISTVNLMNQLCSKAWIHYWTCMYTADDKWSENLLKNKLNRIKLEQLHFWMEPKAKRLVVWSNLHEKVASQFEKKFQQKLWNTSIHRTLRVTRMLVRGEKSPSISTSALNVLVLCD